MFRDWLKIGEIGLSSWRMIRMMSNLSYRRSFRIVRVGVLRIWTAMMIIMIM